MSLGSRSSKVMNLPHREGDQTMNFPLTLQAPSIPLPDRYYYEKNPQFKQIVEQELNNQAAMRQ